MIIGPGDPIELDPDLVYEAVSRAIGAATGLTVLDQMLGNTATPAIELNRSVRIDPGQLDANGGRARPGDEVEVIERIALVITHGYDPNAHRWSYAVAASDFRDLLRAILTRTEISGLASPLFKGRSIKRVGTFIEQTATFTLSYAIHLPEATGPE